MRELILLSGLMFLGYLTESTARIVLGESCRIYVQLTHEATAEQIIADAAVAAEEPQNVVAEITIVNTQEEFGSRRF